MSIPKSKESLNKHKENAMKSIENYIDTLIHSDDMKTQGKADKLCYWFEDYIKFLNLESSFDSSKYPKFKKGQIIKAHLGFNIGSEEGGLHYAIVIENNSVRSPTLNIVPLTSVKNTTDVSNIRSDLGCIFLGNELYRLLDTKVRTLQANVNQELEDLTAMIATLEQHSPDIPKVRERLDKCKAKIELYPKLKKEISKMKAGSIALVRQITTISKIRIYGPKNSQDVLGGIRMSNETMDKIDNAIKTLFTKNTE